MMKKLFLVLAVLQLIGCAPEELPPANTEVVIIDPANPETYTWSNWNDLDMGWVTVANGEGCYSFSLNKGCATLHSNKPIVSATYHQSAMANTGTALKVSNNNTITTTLSKNGLFKIKY